MVHVMSEVKDWCKKPEVCNTLGNGWCVRISGTDVFDGINQYGCKTLRTFDIVRGLSSEEEAKAYLAQWLSEQLPDFDAQRLRADTAEAELRDVKRSNEVLRNQSPSEISRERITAAEQRIAELTTLIAMAKELLSTISMHQGTAPKDWCESFKGEVSRSIATLDAALNPNHEAESHES